jgi:hypothetical protein
MLGKRDVDEVFRWSGPAAETVWRCRDGSDA